jgi:hypothetical protein
MIGSCGLARVRVAVPGACLAAAMLLAGPCLADSPPEHAEPPTDNQDWRLAISVGVQSWPVLADLQPSVDGAFESTGLVFELAIHGPVPFGKNWGWLLGLDAGISSTAGDIPGLVTSLDADLLYLTPSVKIPLGGAPLFLDLGAGYYRLDFGEVDCSIWYGFSCLDLGERWSKDTVGGYMGLTWEIPLGESGSNIALSLRMSYANFGTPGALGPSPGQLDEPLTTFLVGWSF